MCQIPSTSLMRSIMLLPEFKAAANTGGSCRIHKNRTMHQSQTIAAFALIQIGCGTMIVMPSFSYCPVFPRIHARDRINSVGRLVQNEQLWFVYQHTASPSFVSCPGKIAASLSTKGNKLEIPDIFLCAFFFPCAVYQKHP